jgi:cytochrome c
MPVKSAARGMCRLGLENKEKSMKAWVAAATLLLAASPLAVSADDASAEALAKKSGCLKCHSVSAKKDGPSFKETAAKYKGKPDAEQKLFTHLTTNPKVKVDGKEEAHDNLKTKNEADVKDVVRWILSR